MFKIKSNFIKILALFIGITLLLVIPFSSALAASPQEGPPAFNLLEFLKTAGILFTPMLAIVFGVVDYLGKWGVKGKWQLASSLIAGLVLGGIVMYFTTYPATAVAWFSVALFGLLIGLAASGCYNGIEKASIKGAEKALSAGGKSDPPQ
jgi:hypothetical protein